MKQTKKVLIADRFDSSAIAMLKARGYDIEIQSDPQAIDLCPSDIEGLIIRSRCKINERFLKTAESLQVIVSATSGFDHIDFSVTTERKIQVMHTPEANAQSAAELAWALLLACARKIPRAHSLIHSQSWDRKKIIGQELSGKSIGIIGMGRVGQRVARFADAFGLKIKFYDPYLAKEMSYEKDGLMEVLRSSDILSLHVPLTNETKHLINHQTLDHIHQSPILINTSRGEVICENDLVMALESGLISMAGLDVFETEPLPNDSSLIANEKVVLSPHIGANTEQAFRKASIDAANQLIDFLENSRVKHSLPPTSRWYQKGFHGE